MAILKAARQLAVEANVHVHIRKFSVINQARLRSLNTRVIPSAPQEPRWGVVQVGAVSIDAKLDCDAFASTHSATSHYDRASFVGACVRACVRKSNGSSHPVLTIRPIILCRPRVAARRRADLLRCVAHDSIKPQQ